MPAQILNEETLYLRIPALAFLGIGIIMGILGHSAIIYIYGFRMKQTNVFLFINLLSISDITSCVIAVPLEIYRIRVFYTYHKPYLCKVEMYVIFACYINSTFLLLVISVERYMRVCRSSSQQMEFSSARKLGFVSAMMALVLAVPACIWTETKPFLIDATVDAHSCSPSLDPNFFKYALVVFGGSFPVWAIMLGLYLKILMTVKRQANWNVEAATGVRKRSQMRIKMDRKLSKTNRSIICITIVFVSTCTLYFCFILLNTFSQRAKSTNPLHYLLFLLNEAWVINIMFNPFIFGFMNEDFRNELFKIVRVKYEISRRETIEESTKTGNKNQQRGNEHTDLATNSGFLNQNS